MAASKVENGEVDDEELEDKAAGGSCSNSNRQEEPQTDLLTNPHLLTKKKRSYPIALGIRFAPQLLPVTPSFMSSTKVKTQ